MITGQEKICSRIDKSTLDSFPRSLMLVGSYGSGKHLIVDYISKKFNLTTIDITTELDQESIEELYNRVEPYLYIIRANELTVKQENTILKFLEEPLKNSYIVLLAETDIGLLPTIVNRCQVWHLQNYTREFLMTFTTNENILKVANTPGQIKDLVNSSFDEMIALADKIINNIHIASVSNTLTLSNKLVFNNKSGQPVEKDKFNVKLFIDVLLNRFLFMNVHNQDLKYVKGYYLTNELKKKLSVKNLDYKALFEKYLIELRDFMRSN